MKEYERKTEMIHIGAEFRFSSSCPQYSFLNLILGQLQNFLFNQYVLIYWIIIFAPAVTL